MLVAAIIAAIFAPPWKILLVMIPLVAVGELVVFFMKFSRPERVSPEWLEQVATPPRRRAGRTQ
jgi:hypothetical protein